MPSLCLLKNESILFLKILTQTPMSLIKENVGIFIPDIYHLLQSNKYTLNRKKKSHKYSNLYHIPREQRYKKKSEYVFQ